MPEIERAAALPRFPVLESQSEESFLRTLVADGLSVRLDVRKVAEPEIYRARAQRELDVICSMGHARYFLIVSDITRWAKSRDIPVGPGRGSSAGCLVAWTLDITDIDPIEHGLLFERFLNPERAMLPDIGVDVCVRRRDEAVRYVTERYGNDHVARLAAQPGWIDFPCFPGVTVAITDRPVGEHIPCHVDRGFALVTQLDKAAVESAGLITFDFHDLNVLTVIRDAVELIDEQRRIAGELPLDIARIPKDDPAVFRMLAAGDTTGVFQLESEGMRALLRQLRPDRIEDLLAAVTLYRPGPIECGMVDDFIARKHGRDHGEHPLIAPLLADTYGVIVYQEQAMQIAQAIAGYSLGRADLLRRALGKRQNMSEERDTFVAAAVARGIDAEMAGGVFAFLAKWTGYSFNRAHAAAYAWMTYQTAYLKHYFPDELAGAAHRNPEHP